MDFSAVLHFIGLNSVLLDYLRYFSGAIGYFVLGYYLTVKDNIYLKSPRFGLILFLLGSLITIIGTILSSYIMASQVLFFIKLGDLTPGAFLQGIGLFIMIFNTDFNNVKPRINSLMTKISKDSYGIYLVNILLVNILYKSSIFNFELFTLFMIASMMIIVLIFSNLIIDIMDKIPFLKVFTGKS